MAWPITETCRDLLVEDSLGRTAIKAMPTITRTPMFPEPWLTNPLSRYWNALRGHTPPPRHKQEAAREDGNWRRVGTMRRYILLILTLFQTAVATWYMKTILPYQGWALIDPMDMLHQDLLQSTLQLLPYVLQSGILILSPYCSAGCRPGSGRH